VEIFETVRVTRAFGREPGNLEMLWFLRDVAERHLSDHLTGVSLTAEEWAAVNTPDEAWETKAEGYTPPPVKWREIKDKYVEEMAILVELAKAARRNVRIATGHEKIKNMVCR